MHKDCVKYTGCLKKSLHTSGGYSSHQIDWKSLYKHVF